MLAPVVADLRSVLANQIRLKFKTQICHWNVTGAGFVSLHKLFGDQYEALEGRIDQTAEIIRGLQEMPASTLTDLVAKATINEVTPKEANSMVRTLLQDHMTILSDLRKANEAAEKEEACEIANYYQELILDHEKMAWQLRAYLA